MLGKFLHGFPEGFCDLGFDMLWHSSKDFFLTWNFGGLIFPINVIPLIGVGHVIWFNLILFKLISNNGS